MKDKPLVSISCITYNHAPYIRQCLDGFIMQKTNFAYEILIHDDASTDGTIAVIREYEHKYPDVIKPIYEVENQWSKGRVGSIIFNIPRAQGKYIALCEGDDYWIDPFKLQKQVDFLEKNKNYDLCCSASRLYLQDKGEFVGHGGTQLCEDYETCIQGGNDIFTATTLIRTDAYKKCYGDLSSFLPNDLIFDTAYWYWFAYFNKVKYFDEETAVYRMLENSASHTTDNETELRMAWRFLRLKLYFLLKYPLRENQEEVTRSLISEIETYVSNSRYFTDVKIRQSKTYRVGRFLKKMMFWE